MCLPLRFSILPLLLVAGCATPTTVISTDLTHRSTNGPTYNLPFTMAKFMALGLDLKQTVAMTTVIPPALCKRKTG